MCIQLLILRARRCMCMFCTATQPFQSPPPRLPRYPHEHGRRRNGGSGWEPLVLYDTESGPAPHKNCYWSEYCEYADGEGCTGHALAACGAVALVLVLPTCRLRSASPYYALL